MRLRKECQLKERGIVRLRNVKVIGEQEKG